MGEIEEVQLSLAQNRRLLISYANHTKDKAIHVNSANFAEEDASPDFTQPVVGPGSREKLHQTRPTEGGVKLTPGPPFNDRHGL